MGTRDNNTICGLEKWVPIPSNDSVTFINEVAVAVFNVPTGVFAFLSNLAIIVTVIKTPSLQRPSNILLCTLATADCLTGITVQPIFVAWRLVIQGIYKSCSRQRELSSAFALYSRLVTGWSFVNMAVISCDRCYALSKPFAYRANVTKWGVLKVAVFTSLAWFAIALLSIFVLPHRPGHDILLTLGFTALTITPIVNHIAMFVAIRRHNRQVGDAVSSQQLSVILKRERKVAKDMFIVTLVLVLCVLPKVAAAAFREPFSKLNLYYALFLWSTTLMLLNSCINPVLYFLRDSELRSALKSLFHL